MTAKARIYQQPKTAMQSGLANSHDWILEFAPAAPRQLDPLMGWSGSADTQAQIRLKFDTQEEAVAYAERQALSYAVELARPRRMKPKAYADNFKFNRAENWTH
jgi:hypothetical protein